MNLGEKEDPELSGESARELRSSLESVLEDFLAPELVMTMKCFIDWRPAPLGPSRLVFMDSHRNSIYFLLKLIDKSSMVISFGSHEMKHAL